MSAANKSLLATLLLSSAALLVDLAAIAPAPEIEFASDRVIDLSYTYDAETVYWPHGKGFDAFNLTMTEYNTDSPQKVFYRTGYYTSGEHGGTHLDTPAHLLRNGTDAENLKIDQLMGPVVVISIAEQIRAGHLDHALSVADIAAWETQHGPVPLGAFVLLFSEWGGRWPDPRRVFNVDSLDDLQDSGRMRFPGFHPDATRWLIGERRIKGVGADGPSVESSVDIGSGRLGTHRLLAEHGLVGLENVDKVEKVPATGASLLLMPMKISNATGTPVRIFAILPSA